MTYPDIEETKKWIDQWKARHGELYRVMSQIEDVFGGSVDSPLFYSVWDVFDGYTDHLAHRLGDEWAYWLEWWRSECDMGATPKQARSGAGKRMRKIKTTADLARLIVESRK